MRIPAVPRRAPVGASFMLLALATLPAAGLAQAPAPGDSARAIHLLSRATFGVRPGDVASLLTTGRDAWLEKQLHPARIRDTINVTLERRYPSTSEPPATLARVYRPQAQPQRGDSMRRANAAAAKTRPPQQLLLDLAGTRIERSMRSDRQLEEVMTDFWFNHFNVFFQKGADRYLIADYERNAIRPHVFGKFEDMLRATAAHPAMLFYLDNWQSVHVDSSLQRLAARRAGANAQQRMQRGLNENYARELLELHTLGVDGGYTQKDVIDVARAFTGWTFNPQAGDNARNRQLGEPFEFAFRSQLHDRTAKTVLGHRLAAGRGIEDGEEVLHILATHPSTAKFVAAKLVEYFVTDDEAPELVARLAAEFTRTDGDLRAVTRALFTDSLFYATQYRGAKVKTPYQIVVSALRVTDAQFSNSRGVLQVLRNMGQMPYMASAPTGYPAASEDWVNSAALLARMNFGIDYASGRVSGVRPRSGGSAVDAMASSLLPGVNTSRLVAAVQADLGAHPELTAQERNARALGLLLGSPEFQRR